MSKGLTRREFTAGAAALGVLGATGVRAGVKGNKGKPDLVVAQGPDASKNVAAAIAALGGMGAYVKKGQTVGLLLNFLCTIPGGRTKPEVIRSVVAQCRAAGAKEIQVLNWGGLQRWIDTGLKALLDELKVTFRHTEPDDAKGWISKAVPNGKSLSKVRLLKSLEEPDVLLTLPVFKQHGGCAFSGAQKIFMATSHPEDNRGSFHREGNKVLEQCIADLCTVARKADLVVMEAMEVLTENGPFGPGAVTKPEKIVVSTDPVAIDAYCAPIQGVDPKKSTQITAGAARGVGQADLSKIMIKEI